MIDARIEMPEGILPSDDLPDGWTLTTMGRIADVVGGGTPKSSDSENFSEDGHPWITPADLSGFRELHIRRGRRDLSEKGLRSCSAVVMPAGTVLMSSRAPIGYVAIAANPVCTNQGFKSFVCHSEIDSEFVYFWLRLITPHLEEMGSGSTFTEISGSRAKEIPMILAPAVEQSRIAAQIKRTLPSVNSARDHLSRVPAILKRFRQAVLASACSGRLTEDWRDNQSAGEPTSLLVESVLAERKAGWARTKYRPPSEMDSDDLPDLPESWRWVSFDSLVTDSFYGPRFSTDDYAPEGVPTIRTSDISFDGSIQLNSPPRLRLSEELLRDLCLRHEDLLVTRTGATIGKCALYEESIGPAIPSAYLIRFRLTRKTVPPKYVLLFLMSPLGQQRLLGGSTAVAQPNVNAKNIGKFPVPLPPRSEITEIVRRVELLLALADTLEERVAAATSRANNLTQSILAKAFRGELVPTEAELARREGREYEPASVLLERIRARRVGQAETPAVPKRKLRKASAHV